MRASETTWFAVRMLISDLPSDGLAEHLQWLYATCQNYVEANLIAKWRVELSTEPSSTAYATPKPAGQIEHGRPCK